MRMKESCRAPPTMAQAACLTLPRHTLLLLSRMSTEQTHPLGPWLPHSSPAKQVSNLPPALSLEN